MAWYRRWMERHRPGQNWECYIDDEASGVGSPVRPVPETPFAIPRLLPQLHVPQYVMARARLRRLGSQFDEGHVIGASPVHGWAMPRKVPSLSWFATTLADERDAVIPLVDARRRLLYRATLPALRRMETAALHRMRRVVTMSPHTARLVYELGIPARRIGVVAVPIELPDVDTVATPRVGVLFVARAHDPRKGFARLVDLVRASEAVRSVGVDVVSSGAPDIVPEDVGSAVRWRGRAPDLSERFTSAEVFVLPSFQEGLGIVAFEALAGGTPVVAFSCGGPDDFLRESGGACVVDTPAQFRTAVERLLASPAMREEFGGRGREWVAAHMSADEFLSDSGLFDVDG